MSSKKETKEKPEETVSTADETAAANQTAAQAADSNETAAEDQPVVKSGGRRVKVKDFFGSYKDAQFNDDGVCSKISDATLDSLRADYPGAEIEELS